MSRCCRALVSHVAWFHQFEHDVEPPTRFLMSPPFGVVSGCSTLCLVCFFFVLLVEATYAVQSLTRCDRCFINAKRGVVATV